MARPNALKGSAEEPGTITAPPCVEAYPDIAGLLPSFERLDDLEPTTPMAYPSGPTSHSGEFALGVSRSARSARAPLGWLAPAPAAPISDGPTMISSPITSILTGVPFMATSSPHLPGSGMTTRSTPICRARMAMCDNRSTGALVMTAATPGGMSSRPPRRDEITTVGVAERSSPWMSANSTTLTMPAWRLSSGLPVEMISHAERPAPARTSGRAALSVLETANIEWPRTHSSPKLTMYCWSHPACEAMTLAGYCANAQ
mmetsp:Transcript_25794/g.64558  ORF Transcript_25794/g.64558 Transcript_25794/m.64558 type:complete len:259 (+) Transcript_25794:1229-2005(+)